jgi:hypothetical protein
MWGQSPRGASSSGTNTTHANRRPMPFHCDMMIASPAGPLDSGYLLNAALRAGTSLFGSPAAHATQEQMHRGIGHSSPRAIGQVENKGITMQDGSAIPSDETARYKAMGPTWLLECH